MSTSAEWVRRRFTEAWNQVPAGQPPPDLDQLLRHVPEAERPPLREELESLDQERRQRATDAGAPVGTIDFAPAAPLTPPPLPPGERGRGEGTVDFVPPKPSDTRDLMPDLGATTDAAPADPNATAAPEAGKVVGVLTARTLPDAVAGYEILGVLGRGAMGVVYKARQRGLQRIVALKMILSGDHAGEHELGRFRTEAEAVARIQHPNIVQIYEVGEDAGKPFFSLEYVDGGSLAGKIDHVPQPPKEAARLMHQLAGAMDAAHRVGVIHRDLKPANVLMTRDGAPKITDFGLAKRLEEDSGQTHSGSILGSPGYMSPEQAEGRNEAVGPLSDVYALGVILYEMLTGRIPFRAPTVLETLELIRTREPAAPTLVQPTAPRDLETICLKCLQKDPKKRYETAGALAEDMRRYLNNEPILARPVGWGERAWRWCRRNPRLALMGAATAVVIVVWLVSMTVLSVMLKAQKDQSDQNAAAAVAAKKEADQNAATAKTNEKRANAGADTAVRRMTELVGSVQQKLNGKFFSAEASPELRGLRDDVLAKVRESMTNMAQDLEKVGATEFSEAGTYELMGDRLKHLGRGTEALKQYRLSCDILEKTAREQPDSDKAQANFAAMLMTLGDMELELNGDAAAARDDCARALSLRQQVVDHPRSHDYPDLENKLALSHAELHLGRAYLALGDSRTARDHLDRSVSLRKEVAEAFPDHPEGWSYLVEAYEWRGTAETYLGDAQAARASFDEAQRVQQKLVEKNPGAFWYKADLADVLGRRGDMELRLDTTADAEDRYQKSLEYLRPALKGAPEETDYQLQLAATQERLAAAAERKDEADAERTAYQEALQIRQELLAIEPNNLTWQAAYLRTLAHCGQHAEAARKAQELCKLAPKSVPLQMEAARCFAVCAGKVIGAAAKQRYTDQAVACLRAATAAGYKDAAALKTDPELAPLLGTASYDSLLQELAKQ